MISIVAFALPTGALDPDTTVLDPDMSVELGISISTT